MNDYDSGIGWARSIAVEFAENRALKGGLKKYEYHFKNVLLLKSAEKSYGNIHSGVYLGIL